MKKTSRISVAFLAMVAFLYFCLAGCGKEEEPAEQSDIHREEVKGDYGVGSVDTPEGDDYVCIGVQAHYMQLPRYIGVAAMTAGIVFGILGLKDDK